MGSKRTKARREAQWLVRRSRRNRRATGTQRQRVEVQRQARELERVVRRDRACRQTVSAALARFREVAEPDPRWRGWCARALTTLPLDPFHRRLIEDCLAGPARFAGRYLLRSTVSGNAASCEAPGFYAVDLHRRIQRTWPYYSGEYPWELLRSDLVTGCALRAGLALFDARLADAVLYTAAAHAVRVADAAHGPYTAGWRASFEQELRRQLSLSQEDRSRDRPGRLVIDRSQPRTIIAVES